MNYIVLFNGKPVEMFKHMHQAVRFKRYCRKSFRILTTIEPVLV